MRMHSRQISIATLCGADSIMSETNLPQEEQCGDDGDGNSDGEDDRKPSSSEAAASSDAGADSEGEDSRSPRSRKRPRHTTDTVGTAEGEPPAPPVALDGVARAPAVSVISMQEKWDEMFHRLARFKAIHGHCLVPNRYKEDTSLGSWVATQRRTYKILTSGGSASSGMNLDRASRLNGLGFEWSTTDPRHRPWEERYEELKSFVAANGHAEVPMRWDENVQLSNWVSKQRQDYKLLQLGKTTRLTEKRRKLLNDVGFVWEIPRKGRRLRVAKKIKKTSNSATTSTSRGSISPGVASWPPLNSPTTSYMPPVASLVPSQTGLQMAQSAVYPPAAQQVMSVSALQTALAGQLGSSPGATMPNGNGAPNHAPDVVQGILGALSASTQNVHVANVVALAQLILNAQNQQQTPAPAPAPVALPAAFQQPNGLGQPAATAPAQQDNAFMGIIQGIMQRAAQQQQQAVLQPNISALNLQSIATAIISAQLGGGAAGQQPALGQAPVGRPLNSNGPTSNIIPGILPSQVNQLFATNPSAAVVSNSSSSTAVGSTASQVAPQQQQAQQLLQVGGGGGQGGQQPTFILLPVPMAQAVRQQQLQQQQQQQVYMPLQQPGVPGGMQQALRTAAGGALDMNALAGLGVTPEMLGSLGVNPLQQQQQQMQLVQQQIRQQPVMQRQQQDTPPQPQQQDNGTNDGRDGTAQENPTGNAAV